MQYIRTIVVSLINNMRNVLHQVILQVYLHQNHAFTTLF